MENLSTAPPENVDPYETLGISSAASAAEIKTAYKKLALLNHPDKVPPTEKHDAHIRFQKIAFAYAVLSDERRRRRYDATGNTAESLDIEDDDFNWVDFFRTQWQNAVTEDSINGFKDKYQGSDEEKRDVLAAFKKFEGNMNKLFQEVMLSNPLDDEDRYRQWIDEEIAFGNMENFDKYRLEKDSGREARKRRAEREAREVDEHRKETKNQRKKNNGIDADGMADLAALIQGRQKERASNFLDNMEAKYGQMNSKGKVEDFEGPSEEAFRKNAHTRTKKRGPPPAIVDDHEEEDEDVDLAEDSPDFEEKEDVEVQTSKDQPSNSRKKKTLQQRSGKARKAKRARTK